MQPPWSTATSTITAPGFMPAHHVLADDDRRPAAGHEHGADHEVGVGHAALDRAAVRRQRHDPAPVDLVDPAQPVEVLVEQHDLGLHAGGDPRRVPADVAGAEHDDLGRAHAGRAAHQHAPAAVVALEEVGAHLRGEPAGDLAHRRQQRQRAVGELHGLVGERGRAGGEQRLGDLGVGGEVEVGEQREVGAQEARTPPPCGSLTLTTICCAQASAAVGTMSAPAAT